MLSKRNQTQKSHILYGFIHIKCLEQANLQRKEVDCLLPRLGELGENEEFQVSFESDKNVKLIVVNSCTL